MIPADLRLFNPKGPDHVAVIAVEPAYGRADAYMLRLGRGASGKHLTMGKTYGPYNEAELPAPHAELVTSLIREGFLPGGAHGAMQRLFSDSPATRGRAAERLGWGGHPHAVEALTKLLPNAVDEVCAVIDALGRLGERNVLPLIRPYAARKLLSRRRSAVEAMRNLGDGEGLTSVRARTLEELPPNVRDALLPIESILPTPEQLAQLLAACNAAEPKRRGLIADLLYERATPTAVNAARALIEKMTFDQPFMWRYIKSVLKRSTLRDDFRSFGWLIHQVEWRGVATSGSTHVVKSGYDGNERPTRIFGRRTQDYLRRSAWRYLRRLAMYRSHVYTAAAAEALIHYSQQDAQAPRRRYGAFAACYLLNRILWGGSPRYEFVGRSMKFRLREKAQVAPPPGAREEAFAAHWDAYPTPFLRLLAAAKLVEVQEFALAGINRHAHLLAAASVDDLIGMLDAPQNPTVELAMGEITRRFDPKNPDWTLIDRLVMDTRTHVADLGLNFLRDNVATWANDPDRIVALLTSPSARTRALAAELTIQWLKTDNRHHRILADRLLAILRKGEPGPGAHESLARVLREALNDSISANLSTDELLHWIAQGSPAAQGVAGDLLGKRPEALAALGINGVTALAQHPLAAVRSAGHSLLRSARAHWADDPSVLLALVESEWDDTRAVALDLLSEQLDFATVGVGTLLGLLDSNRVDVQNTGIDLARKNFDKLNAAELVSRLVEHPHRNMRAFALELVMNHLADDAAQLAGLERFCRTILLDTWPSRKAKDQLIAFLGLRGLRDATQAAIAARVLGEALALRARCDFESALAALTRIKLAYPQIPANVGLPQELLEGVG